MTTEMETWGTKKFPDGVLEHVARVIGDQATGSEIKRVLKDATFSTGGAIGTKWVYLYNHFYERNKRPHGQYGVRRFIENFCDPTRWIARDDDRKELMNALNIGLAYMNVQLDKDGKLIITKEKVSHVLNAKPSETKTEPNKMTVSPVFRARDFKKEENLCFVLMPFEAPFEELYRGQIKPAVEVCGFKCKKADDFFSPTPILDDIWTCICMSKVIIADVTGRNPNVFYEMGIAHTVGKPIIIITQDKTYVPFDVAHLRYFLYSNDAPGRDKLRRNLTSALATIPQDNKS